MEERKTLWVHAFQPTEKEIAKREEAIKKYKYVCWLPESQAVVGDVHAFFNDLADVHMCKDYITKYYKRVEEYFKPTVPTPREDFNPQQFVDELSVSELDVELLPVTDETVEKMKRQVDVDEVFKQAGAIIRELEDIRSCHLDFDSQEWKQVGVAMERAKAIRLLLKKYVTEGTEKHHPADDPKVITDLLGKYTGKYVENQFGFGIEIYNQLGEQVAYLDEAETSTLPDHIRNNPKTLNIYVNERMAD